MSTGTPELERRYGHHPPRNQSQIERYDALRKATLEFAKLIDYACPDSREKSDALTNLDYVLSQAIGAIARREGD